MPFLDIKQPFNKQVEADLISLPLRCGMKPLYKLRWRFVFADNRVDRIGPWNRAVQHPDLKEMAAGVNKYGLVAAMIEAEHIAYQTVRTVFVCDGNDYVTCKWIGAVSSGNPIGWKHDTYKLEPKAMGLAFMTRKERYAVYVDGSYSRKMNTEYEKQFKLREHSV